MSRKLRLGLALGSGSARGWAHIGVIRALEERGVKPEIVCGSSIGALVGAAYASGELDRWSLGVSCRHVGLSPPPKAPSRCVRGDDGL